MVASIRIAAASPTPNCLKIIACSVPKIAKTPTITIAALVTTPAVVLIPWAIASSVRHTPVVGLADAAEDEHVVVHREPEEDHEEQESEGRGRCRP